MEHPPPNESPLPTSFEQWLRDQPVRCSEEFDNRLRARLNQPATDLDSTIDDLLRPNPAFYNAAMARHVRAALLHDNRRPQRERLWWILLRPLAAAALLSLTFWSFQQEPSLPRIGVDLPATAHLDHRAENEADLHLIFALASSLETETTLAHLDTSPDHWAFLLD
jgi:hypothetical protein